MFDGHRRARIAAWVALYTVVLAGCSGASHDDRAGRSAPVVEVVTAAAELRPLGTDLEAVGTARANESADITTKVTSTVSAIRFREGEQLRRGAVLVELESHAQQADVREAEASLTQTEAQLARGRVLREQQLVSASELELLEASVLGDRARLDAARARLADTVIRAGFDGRAGFRRVSVGSLVEPADVITTLDDLSRIKLEFTVPEGSLFLLQPGLEISATTPGLPGRSFTGRVSALDPRIDVNTRSIRIRAEIPNPGAELRPGMFMTVNLHTPTSPAILVPEEAVIPEQGNAFVLVVANGVVERRKVKTGRRRPGEVEIVSGLEPDERVVTRGVQNVREGSAVREAG